MLATTTERILSFILVSHIKLVKHDGVQQWTGWLKKEVYHICSCNLVLGILMRQGEALPEIAVSL
jgi:hypothetical protein